MKSKSLERMLLSEKRKETRKEKSKEAARCRRGQESMVYEELIASLPVSEKIKPVLDKTQVIRLSINYIKTRQLVQSMLGEPEREIDATLEARDIVHSMDGFVMLVAASCEVLYVTENVKRVIGLSQTDITGCMISEFMHPSDMTEMESMLYGNAHQRQFTARFKSALLAKGRLVNLKSAAYKPILFQGHRLQNDDKSNFDSSRTSRDDCWLLTVYPISDGETELVRGSTFTSLHDLKMTFKIPTARQDNWLYEETKFSADQLGGSTLFSLIHPQDIPSIRAAFKDLYTKTKTVTPCYSLLAGGGGFLRVVTHASLINHPRTHKPDQVLCVHHIVSGIEQAELVLSDVQISHGLCYPKTEKSLVEVKMEADSPSEGCKSPTDCEDVSSMTASVFQDLSEVSSDGETSEDIFSATAGVFECSPINSQVDGAFEQDVCEIEALTASMFSDSVGPVGPFNPLIDDLNADEALNDDDLYIDATNLDLNYDSEEFMMRAPYIPMDDVFPFDTNMCKVSEPCVPSLGSSSLGGSSLGSSSLGSSSEDSPSEDRILSKEASPMGIGDLAPYASDLTWLVENNAFNQRGVKRTRELVKSEEVREARSRRLDPEFLAAELEKMEKDSRSEIFETTSPDFLFYTKHLDAPISEGHSYLDRPGSLMSTDLHRLVTGSWNTRPPISNWRTVNANTTNDPTFNTIPSIAALNKRTNCVPFTTSTFNAAIGRNISFGDFESGSCSTGFNSPKTLEPDPLMLDVTSDSVAPGSIHTNSTRDSPQSAVFTSSMMNDSRSYRGLLSNSGRSPISTATLCSLSSSTAEKAGGGGDGDKDSCYGSVASSPDPVLAPFEPEKPGLISTVWSPSSPLEPKFNFCDITSRPSKKSTRVYTKTHQLTKPILVLKRAISSDGSTLSRDSVNSPGSGPSGHRSKVQKFGTDRNVYDTRQIPRGSLLLNLLLRDKID